MNLLMEHEIWLIAALVFIASDVILGLNFILLSFGLGAAATGCSLLLNDTAALPHTENWETLLTFFAVTSLVLLVPIRKFATVRADDSDEDDINKY